MISRTIVYCVIVAVIVYDVPCGIMGWPTISEGIRQVDRDTNQLVRWFWLALWGHLWVTPWWTP